MNDQITKQLVDALLGNQRKERFWRNIRFFIGVVVIIAIFILVNFSHDSNSAHFNSSKPYVALVRLQGEIMPGQPFSAIHVIPQLQRAFADKNAKAVILDINSPGGSAVQASLIHDAIMRLKKQYHKRVVVVGEDALASGAYMIAVAADQIYVNPDTITGSIGVVMSGFGFNDTIQKLGITRRVFTAGTNKDRLDPFEPLRKQDISKVHILLSDVHDRFVAMVKQGRGDRLNVHAKGLFSGDFWTGAQAKKLGLVDGTADLWQVMSKQFHVRQFKDYSDQPNMLDQLAHGLGTELHFHMLTAMSSFQARMF